VIVPETTSLIVGNALRGPARISARPKIFQPVCWGRLQTLRPTSLTPTLVRRWHAQWHCWSFLDVHHWRLIWSCTSCVCFVHTRHQLVMHHRPAHIDRRHMPPRSSLRASSNGSRFLPQTERPLGDGALSVNAETDLFFLFSSAYTGSPLRLSVECAIRLLVGGALQMLLYWEDCA